MSSSFSKNVVVLGTGGTIAGLTSGPTPAQGYDAAQVGVAQLVEHARLQEVALGERWQLIAEQVAQIDSKDMERSVWHALCTRCSEHLKDPHVAALLITHGTDTLAETAYLLHRLFAAASKPIVLTGAMRAHDDPQADGPGNFRDALDLARRLTQVSRSGVWVVFDGVVHDPMRMQKISAQSLHAFYSMQEDGHKDQIAPERLLSLGLEPPHFSPFEDPMNWANWMFDPHLPAQDWPRIAMLSCHADMAMEPFLDYLISNKSNTNQMDRSKSLSGLVLCGMGSGTWPQVLEASLLRLMDGGLEVVLCSQVPWGLKQAAKGAVLSHERFHFSTLEPKKARIALMLHVLAQEKNRA